MSRYFWYAAPEETMYCESYTLTHDAMSTINVENSKQIDDRSYSPCVGQQKTISLTRFRPRADPSSRHHSEIEVFTCRLTSRSYCASHKRQLLFAPRRVKSGNCLPRSSSHEHNTYFTMSNGDVARFLFTKTICRIL